MKGCSWYSITAACCIFCALLCSVNTIRRRLLASKAVRSSNKWNWKEKTKNENKMNGDSSQRRKWHMPFYFNDFSSSLDFDFIPLKMCRVIYSVFLCFIYLFLFFCFQCTAVHTFRTRPGHTYSFSYRFTTNKNRKYNFASNLMAAHAARALCFVVLRDNFLWICDRLDPWTGAQYIDFIGQFTFFAINPCRFTYESGLKRFLIIVNYWIASGNW